MRHDEDPRERIPSRCRQPRRGVLLHERDAYGARISKLLRKIREIKTCGVADKKESGETKRERREKESRRDVGARSERSSLRSLFPFYPKTEQPTKRRCFGASRTPDLPARSIGNPSSLSRDRSSPAIFARERYKKEKQKSVLR